MESSTTQSPDQPVPEGTALEHPLFKEDWQAVVKKIPVDLEQTAREQKAFRRQRCIPSAQALLRLAFLYTLEDWSLRLTALWAVILNICEISDVDLMRRLRGLSAWLGVIVAKMLEQRGIRLRAQGPVRLRILDATVVSKPKSKGTDYRVHLDFDLGSLSIAQVLVSDEHRGESFGNFALGPGDIGVTDSAYARTRSLEHPLLAGAKVVSREQWNTMPVYDQAGQQADLIAWLKRTFPEGTTGPQELPVWLPTAQGWTACRLVACPLPPEKAHKARERAQKRSRRKKHQPMPQNLFAVGFLLLITNLEAAHWSSQQVLDLYRFRWQIELYFKRLKSLLGFDHLRSQNAELGQTYLLAKLLAAILVDSLRSEVVEQVPDLFDEREAPVSIWRLDMVLIHTLSTWVIGDLPAWNQILKRLSRSERHLCGSPRKRRQQLAQARSLLHSLRAC